MKINNATFFTSSSDLESCPASELPEFAFIGRSNVGKSSLINMITAKKELAKTSSTPGKTRLINFFTINNVWSLVDLPGYGYAKVSKSERKDFGDATGNYLLNRESIKCIFALIDSRNDPMEIDLEFINWLAYWKRPFALVFTKSDKISAAKLQQQINIFSSNLEMRELAIPPIFSTSTKEKQGRGPLLQHIEKFLPKSAKGNAQKQKSMASLKWAKKWE